MKRLIHPSTEFRVFVFVLLSIYASAHAVENPAGTWKVRTMFRGRQGRTAILQLQRHDNNLTGVMSRSEDSKLEINNGRFRQGELSFDVVSQWNGQQVATKYTGSIHGDSIKGQVEYRRRGEQQVLNWTAERTTEEEIAKANANPPVLADVQLTKENYDLWRTHIVPAAQEQAWAKIPWLTTFKDGIVKAEEAEKPLLLWTMNGHPLGCT